MSRIDDIRAVGYSIGDGLKYIDFWAAKNYEALVRLPYIVFAEYVPDGQREYERGEVIRVGCNKYLLQNWGKIDPAIPPPINPLCKLFRDKSAYDPDGTPREWVKEEYCLRDFERLYNGLWYIVIADRVDSGTPPSNDAASWAVKPGQ